MRPLLEPLSAFEAFAAAPLGVDVVPLLLDRMGAYCAICERPILERSFAWDAESGTAVSPYREGAPSTRSLLLCETCDAAQALRDDDPHVLALPFEGQTFSIEGPTLFAYERWGGVVPLEHPAARTIEYFDFNRQPDVDSRTRLRAGTWGLAEAAARRYANDETGLERIWLPYLVQLTGFLSVWTIALREVLGPEHVVELFAAARREIPDFFPGTDWERLVRAEPEGTAPLTAGA